MFDKLIQLRQSLNKTPAEMAKELKISASLYYKLESGLRKPTYRIMKKFKEVFGITVDELFF